MDKIEVLNDYVSGSGLFIFPVREQPGEPYIDKTGKSKVAKEKAPYTRKGFKDATQDIETIKEWSKNYPTCMWGVDTGRSHLIVIDFDFYKYPDLEIPAFCLETLSIKTAHSGSHLIYKDNGDYHIKSGTDVLGEGIDIRAEGGYSILPPSKIIKEWNSGSPIDVDNSYTWSNDLPIADLPEELLKELEKGKGSIKKTIIEPTKISVTQADDTFIDDFIFASTQLKRLSPSRADDYMGLKGEGKWLGVGMALHDLGEAGLQLWNEWSKQSDKYEGHICEEKWLTFDEDREDKLTIASLKFWADEDNPIINREGFNLTDLTCPQ